MYTERKEIQVKTQIRTELTATFRCCALSHCTVQANFPQ